MVWGAGRRGAGGVSGAGALHLLQGDQARGVVPEDNVWLAASAGTGKTQVLTGRVLRLLLQGVKPGAILGLTFTKAGAAEMAKRVRDRLAEWVQLKDSELADQIFKIGADKNDPAVLARARTLFAEVIDAPGQGLAFQTIHSFCQALLGAFPLEAGLAPEFRAIEDTEARLMRRDLLARLADDAVASGDLPFLRDLSSLSERLGEQAAQSWLDRCAAADRALRTLPAEIAPFLRGLFDLPLSDPDDWLARWCETEADEAGWREIMAEYVGWDTATGIKMATIIGDWLAASPALRARSLDGLLTTVFTVKGELRADFSKKLAAVADLAVRCGEAAQTARQTATAMAASDRYAAALSAGRHFASAWAAHKQRTGLVDFDDLIAHTHALLSGEGRAAWIRYKLDQRIDHILVDEAQDTNAAQWDIIKRLTEEYFAGEGATDPSLRTVFVVGDYKQAIFGFQGTDPANFSEAEAWFGERGQAAERPFERLSIATSYRCAPAILTVVDAVAAQLGAENFGLAPGERIRHNAANGNSGGIVTLWPVERAERPGGEGDGESGAEGWIDDASRRIADSIAKQARRWIDEGYDGTAVTPGDILVLVRQRKELAALIVARLQARGVRVAGVDRLSLDKPLAVQDLLAAARFAIQPLDDLNLAGLLVSPLGDFAQDDLWRYGAGRGSTPLWRHLRGQPDIADKLEPLRSVLAMADYVSPYQFFETILSGPMQGRARLLARLGNAARDPIEELMSQALAFGRDEGPSLHRFLQWFDSRDNEIKRETDIAGGEARVMTVHGAKGLEARFVILADAAGNPARKQDRGFDWQVNDHMTLPVTGFRRGEHPAVLAVAQAERVARDQREHWRLLYVAMTRAKQGLFVTGALGKTEQEPAEDSWYAQINAALLAVAAKEAPDSLWKSGLSFSFPRDRRRDKRPEAAVPGTAIAIPAWARQKPVTEPRPARPLTPSGTEEAEALTVPMTPAGDGFAARRGTLIHALFERLPSVPPAMRADAALRWLAAQAVDLSSEDRREMADAALGVLNDPQHADIFGPGSLAEAPLSALVNGRVIAGTVDRLLVTADTVSVIDFKTGSIVPASAEAVPIAYIKQMAAYCAALSVIFPDRQIAAALLYTNGPRLIALPQTLLDPHYPSD
jgi:ATP-dependent helicase/nuclease subunit A